MVGAFRCKRMDWAPYQRRLIAAVDDPRYATICASWPRGAGKTTVAGWLVARALTPGDPLYVRGGEIVLFAGSIEQCRLVFRQALGFLEPRIREFRTVDSATRVAITRKECRTRLKAIGSNPKTALGMVGTPLVILDEPGALHTVGGEAPMGSGPDCARQGRESASGRGDRHPGPGRAGLLVARPGGTRHPRIYLRDIAAGAGR